MATTLLTLVQKLSESIEDYISVSTTTNIAADNYIYSTHLNEYDQSSDDRFNNWWVYIRGTANDAVERKVKDYTTSGGRLEVYGAALAAECGAVTFELFKYRRTVKLNALNDAIREVYPSLFRPLDDRTLITGNILPNAHFEDQTTSGTPDHYTLLNVTGAKTTTAGLYRGGATSVKLTASAADGYMYISSNSYPGLLDLMGTTIDFKCWAYPEVADDAFLTIYTIKADGTEQTLNSTTACPASPWTLLELEDQSINNKIVEIEFRFRVHTNAKFAYFDNARVNGKTIYELLLPKDLQDGSLKQVWMQSSSYPDDPCDNINPNFDNEIHDWYITDDGIPDGYIADEGIYRYLKCYDKLSSKYLLRLVGYCPLETLTSDTDTISLDGEKLNLLIAYAKYKLYQAVEGVPASQDVRRIQSASERAYGEYLRLLPRQRMGKPSVSLGRR